MVPFYIHQYYTAVEISAKYISFYTTQIFFEIKTFITRIVDIFIVYKSKPLQCETARSRLQTLSRQILGSIKNDIEIGSKLIS